MEWQHLEFLYLILPLTAVWLVLALYSDRRRHRAREAFVAQAMWSRILPEESRLRFWTKLGLTEIAIVMGLMALAGPRYGTQYEDVVARGSDLYVLIDVSRSMLADDVLPTRLGRAKADVSALVNQLEGERVGLIAFAGQAVVKCPLTVDYDSFRRALDELDPESAPRGGTAIGDAIRKALEVFHAQADRDQAILLITDGDDQESYPLEAAAIAAERHVTVFAVGLGDANQGARVPQKTNDKTFLEYKGEQVWSKLDSHLLEEIALKTSGVYVPAGTRAYDLGELYAQHLRGRQANDAASQKRIRRSEQFQIFLALALAALLLDLCITTNRPIAIAATPDRSVERELDEPNPNSVNQITGSRRMSENAVVPIVLILTTFFGVGGEVFAAEPRVDVREGIRLYSREEYDSARVKFATAGEELDKQKSAEAAIAAFDEACACHRKGDFTQARDAYLRAGLSQDRSLAVNAHFNLGNLDAEQARQLAGEKPEAVAPDKRKEILDHLTQSIAAYRHCLELNREHAPSRRNLELVRQWIKFYSDKWSEQDRQKRRDESNLIVFLEYLIQTQSALRETVNHLPTPARPDALAELKRLQDELHQEIPTLREKIANDLRPKPAPGQTAPGQTAPTADSQQLDEAIALLQGWADAAGSRMSVASTRLQAKEPTSAASEQQAAIDELDKIWDAVIPFHPLLAKELADQTAIARELAPPRGESEQESKEDNKQPGKPDTQPATPKAEEKPETEKKAETGDKTKGEDKQTLPPDDKSTSPMPGTAPSQPQVLEEAVKDLSRLTESQEKAIRKTRLLAPKAEAELKRLESAPPALPVTPPADKKPDDKLKDTKNGQPSVDPEQVKAGFRKAIELGPKAVEQMEAAVTAMKQQDPKMAAAKAEEARKTLEEIQKAQPKDDQKQNEDKKDQEKTDQEKKDEEKKNEDKKDEESKSNEQKKKDEEQKKKDEKKQEEKKGEEKKKEDQKKGEDKKEQPQPQPQQGKVSKDRIEEALRAVRERQQAKRERDRKLKGQVIGRSPVDKDW
jgi:Ca-activated chloride channel family protein